MGASLNDFVRFISAITTFPAPITFFRLFGCCIILKPASEFLRRIPATVGALKTTFSLSSPLSSLL